MIFFAAGIANYLFSKHLETGITKPFMSFGRLGLLIYAAYFIGTYQSGLIARIMYYISAISRGNAFWVPFLIFGVIVLDIVGVFRRGKKGPEISA